MKQLLPLEFLEGPHLATAIILELDSCKTSILLDALKNEAYLTEKNITHLKRIRKSQTFPNKVEFLFRLKEDYDEEVQLLIPKDLIAFRTIEVEVPINSPKTKANYFSLQFEQNKIFSQNWPCTFKVQSLEMPIFSSEEMETLTNLMSEAIKNAKIAFEEGHKFNACLVYDPIRKKVLGKESDRSFRKQKSISHSVMNLMEYFGTNFAVTAQQNKNEDSLKNNSKSPLDNQIIDEKKINSSSEDCIVESINKKRKNEEMFEDTLHQYYYCTGLDLIIVEEPCIMCSMALSNKIETNIYDLLKQLLQHQHIPESEEYSIQLEIKEDKEVSMIEL